MAVLHARASVCWLRVPAWDRGEGFAGGFSLFYFCPLLSPAVLRGLAFLMLVAGAVDKHLFLGPLPRNAPGALRGLRCRRGGQQGCPLPGEPSPRILLPSSSCGGI